MITLTTTIEAQKDGSVIVVSRSSGKPLPNETALKNQILSSIKDAIAKSSDPGKATTIVEGDDDYARNLLAQMRDPL